VPTRRWEHFDHDADIGVRGYGATRAEAFAQAALALAALITDPASIRPDQSVTIRCSAPDTERLLVDWLDALVYEMAVSDRIFGEFDVEIEGNVLRGDCRGETIDRARHQPAVEVKGATQTALRVARTPQGQWVAQCVVDV